MPTQGNISVHPKDVDIIDYVLLKERKQLYTLWNSEPLTSVSVWLVLHI